MTALLWIGAGVLFIAFVIGLCAFVNAAMDRKAVDRGWA